MAAWPAILPQNPFGQDGASYEPADNTVRSTNDTGPGKVRRRYTGKFEKFSFGLVLNPAQRAALDTFYEVTLQGVGKFQWKDFRTGAVANYRFIKKPSMAYWGEDASGTYWATAIELELVP